MSDTTKQNDAYEFLNSKQQEVASKVEALLIGFTVKEASDLLHTVRKSIENTKIS